MGAVTLVQAQEHLTEWLKADLAVSQGQSYTIKDRTLTRVHAKEIRESISYWEQKVNSISRGGGMRVRQAVIRDE